MSIRARVARLAFFTAWDVAVPSVEMGSSRRVSFRLFSRSVGSDPIELQAITFYLKQAPSVAQSGLILWCAALPIDSRGGNVSTRCVLGARFPPPWAVLFVGRYGVVTVTTPLIFSFGHLVPLWLPVRRVLPTCFESNFYLPNRTYEDYWRTYGYRFSLTQVRDHFHANGSCPHSGQPEPGDAGGGPPRPPVGGDGVPRGL